MAQHPVPSPLRESDDPESQGEEQNDNAIGTVPFTAFLRPANLPKKPTIWSPSVYQSVSRLVELRFTHGHHLVQSNMKKEDWLDPKVDPNRWSH